jgi:hypothetical protein
MTWVVAGCLLLAIMALLVRDGGPYESMWQVQLGRLHGMVYGMVGWGDKDGRAARRVELVPLSELEPGADEAEAAV